MDAEHGFVGIDDDSSVDVAEAQVKGLAAPAKTIPDGEW
jgi:hypothetical protein